MSYDLFFNTDNEFDIASPLLEPLFPNFNEDAENYYSLKEDSLNDELKPDSILNQLIDNKEKGENQIKGDEKIIPEIKGGSTNITTFNNKKRSNPDKQIFSIRKEPKRPVQKLPAYWRFDAAIKWFKTNSVQYILGELKRLIKGSDIPEECKSKKLYLPNSDLFSAVASMPVNYRFLSLTVKEILGLGKEKHSKQRESYQTLNAIQEAIKNSPISEANDRLREFLEKTYEELIKDFYLSEEFEEFKKSEIAQFHDEGVIKQEKISLLEENGFIRLINIKASH